MTSQSATRKAGVRAGHLETQRYCESSVWPSRLASCAQGRSQCPSPFTLCSYFHRQPVMAVFSLNGKGDRRRQASSCPRLRRDCCCRKPVSVSPQVPLCTRCYDNSNPFHVCSRPEACVFLCVCACGFGGCGYTLDNRCG